MWKAAVIAGLGLSLPLAACDDNPLDESIDEVESLTFDRTFATVLPNDSIIAVVTPTSPYGDPVTTADVDFEACTTGVPLTLSPVTDTTDATLSGKHEIVVHAGSQLGYGCIVATGGGQTDTLRVLVVPDEFLPVQASVAAGDTVALFRAIGQPAFDANTHVFVDDVETIVFDFTADTLRFYLPTSVPVGEVEISVEGAGPNNLTLPGVLNVTATGDPMEPNDWIFGGTATDFTDVTLPISITSDLGDPDFNDVFRFTIADTTEVDFALDWVGTSGDLDFILRRSTGASVSGCNAATSAHPEHDVCVLPPGTYFAQVNDYEEVGLTVYVFDMTIIE